jgi:hypothetical protein
MWTITVLCTNCGLLSHRPHNFVRARRFFICGACKEMIRLDDRTILDSSHGEQRRTHCEIASSE